MSNSVFKQDFMKLLSPSASFENHVHPDHFGSDPEQVTTEDVLETREEQRDTHINATEATAGLEDDLKYLGASENVIASVASASAAATSTSPAVAEAFVHVANLAVDDAQKVLGTDIPHLTNNDDGSIATASMEGLTSWLGTAIKAFGSAASRFFERTMLGFSRLSSSATVIRGRISRVTGKMNHRKGNGGHKLKVDRGIMSHLVLDNNYASDIPTGIQQLVEITGQVNLVLNEYQTRLNEQIKSGVIDAIQKGEGLGKSTMWFNVKVDDLNEKLDAIIAHQPPLLLGNVALVKNEHGPNTPVQYNFIQRTPAADVVAKHLDAPLSLSNEQMTGYLGHLTSFAEGALERLQHDTKQAQESYRNSTKMIQKLVYPDGAEDDVENNLDVNTEQLIRVQNQLVSEVGRIHAAQQRLLGCVVASLNAALVLAEESVFQD